MSRTFRIGVMSDCFRMGPEGGVKKSAELGADGVQVYTTGGKMSAEQMTAADRKAFRKFVADQGLEISALCGDMGTGFHNPDVTPTTIARSKLIVDLAVDLGTDVVTTHIGVVPEDRTDPTYQYMLKSIGELAAYAEKKGVTFATETGPEKAPVLRRILDDVGSRGIGVNLDPANLVMVVADDPVAAVHTLKDYIVHTHAKDGVQIKAADAGKAYDGEQAPEHAAGFRELPLGEGDVPWDAYLAALAEIGYDGYLTIEREVGDKPEADIVKAIAFLKDKIAKR